MLSLLNNGTLDDTKQLAICCPCLTLAHYRKMSS